MNTSRGESRFEINGFIFETNKEPISNQKQLQDYENILSFPLPEMVYGNNFLRVTFNQKTYSFNTLDALKLVELKDSVKVSIAEKWTTQSLQNHKDITTIIKPYDWTYTTYYKGSGLDWKPTRLTIDTEKLLRKDPILFYDDVLLFESELDDHGCSFLNVRIRVQPKLFLILLRFFLRVDHVLVRIVDTRIYHEFDKPFLLREFSVREIKMEELKRMVGNRLTDMNYVSSVVDNKFCKVLETEMVEL